MKKKEIIIIGSVILFLIILITVADALQPEPVDWSPTYSKKAKTPFGLYVLDNEAENLFGKDTVERFWKTPYEYLDSKFDYDNSRYTIKGSVLAIEDNNTLDPESVKELMNFADYGNTVMLSMRTFPQELLDTLNIKMGHHELLIDSIQVSMINKPDEKYWINKGMGMAYFDTIPQHDSVRVLGKQYFSKYERPNFIEAKFGQGRFLLHTQPAAFSNFYLLKADYYQYAQNALSAIPQGSVHWQNKYSGPSFEEDGSTLRYIMSQPGLKWAWRLGLWGLLFFIIFNARRRQRIVPEIAPVRNTTVDFAKTIGNLYFQEGDHQTIIEKKIIYFLENIRTEYLIDTSDLDDAFIEKLHQKTGKPKEDIQGVVLMIKKFRHNFQSTANDVVAINNAIEKLRL